MAVRARCAHGDLHYPPPMPEPIDALLVLSFGGPERREEVMPFLRGIVGPRVPQERLEPIAEHYYALGGKSPINEHNRTLVTALQSELAHRGLPRARSTPTSPAP